MTAVHFLPTGRSRERILVFGAPGVGKSRAYFEIARRYLHTGQPGIFYVVESDPTVDDFLDSERYQGLHVEDGGNLQPFPIESYPEYLQTLPELASTMEPHDWLVVDMISHLWEATQTHYIDEVFGTDVGTFFLEARAAEKKNELEGWTDWKVINKLYRQVATKILRARGHVFGIAGIRGLTGEENEDIKKTYGRLNVRPTGQRDLAHLFRTVMWAYQRPNGAYEMRTAKDREREGFPTGEVIDDFSIDYLATMARWKMTVVTDTEETR